MTVTDAAPRDDVAAATQPVPTAAGIPLPNALPRPRRLPVARPVRPIQLAVAVCIDDHVLRWAAAVGSDPLVSGAVDGAQATEAWSMVVAHIAARLVNVIDLAPPVEIHTPSDELAAAARSLGFDVHALSRTHHRCTEVRAAPQ